MAHYYHHMNHLCCKLDKAQVIYNHVIINGKGVLVEIGTNQVPESYSTSPATFIMSTAEKRTAEEDKEQVALMTLHCTRGSIIY